MLEGTATALVLSKLAVVDAVRAVERGCCETISLGMLNRRLPSWNLLHHGFLLIKSSLDTFKLYSDFVESMLGGSNLVFEFSLIRVQIAQLSLILSHDLLLILKLLLKSLHLSPESLIPIQHSIDLRECTRHFGAFLLVPSRKLLQLLVSSEKIRLQIIFFLLGLGALFAQRGSLLLELS